MAVGTFADQADVWLPLDYVDVSVADPSVAHLDAEGRITALDRGTSYVTARRGDVAAATVVTVGPPANYIEFTTSAYGIDAYPDRSEEHTSELQSLMRISYAVFCLKKKKHNTKRN